MTLQGTCGPQDAPQEACWRNRGGIGELHAHNTEQEASMPILLWLLGVPLPIIILLLLFAH